MDRKKIKKIKEDVRKLQINLEKQKEQIKYLSCAETAKLIRKQLKKIFPNQKFSVRSDTYSMGASINISWENGVSRDDVEKVAKDFEGAGFDGMIDLKYYKDIWLLPDGTAQPTKSQGTESSRGVRSSYDFEKPHKDAILISPGADYIFCNREITKEIQEKVAKKLAEIEQIEYTHLNQYPKVWFNNRGDNWYNIVYQLLINKDLTNFETIKKKEGNICSSKWTDFYEIKNERRDK